MVRRLIGAASAARSLTGEAALEDLQEGWTRDELKLV